MKILFLTGHSFDPSGRKASIHFLASGLKEIGNDVYVLTVGVDILRLIFSRSRNKGVLRYLKWRDDPDGLMKRVNIGIIHQPAREKGVFSKILRLMASGRLPKYVIKSAGTFDVIIIDSGLAVNYFGFIREKYPEAYIMYNAADCLASVGYSGDIINKEKDVLLNADSVRTPSKLLANKFPIGSNYFIIPHGVDKDILLSELDSPFLKDSVNGVLVGNTLLDWDALFAIAIAAERDIIHVFGTPLRAGIPENIILYGEVGFSKLAPYIQHASYALAPYKLSAPIPNLRPAHRVSINLID